MMAFAAGAFGLLLGALLGLSTSPTVATAVTAISALVGAVLAMGLKVSGAKDGAGAATNTPAAMQPASVAAFSLACILGAVLGIGFRTHRVLSPSIATVKQAWLDAQFTEDEAKRLAVLEVLNTTMPSGDKSGKAEGAAGGSPPKPGAHATSLFSTRAKQCKVLTESTFDKPEALMAELESAAAKETDADAAPLGWRRAVEELKALPEEKRLAAGKKLIDALCFIEAVRPASM
jgi:hypothetical protein